MATHNMTKQQSAHYFKYTILGIDRQREVTAFLNSDKGKKWLAERNPYNIMNKRIAIQRGCVDEN